MALFRGPKKGLCWFVWMKILSAADLKSWTSPRRVPRSWSQCWRSGLPRPSTGTRRASRTWWNLSAASRRRNASGAPVLRLKQSKSSTPTSRRTHCRQARRSQKSQRSWTTTERWCGFGSATGDRRWKTRARLTFSRSSRKWNLANLPVNIRTWSYI